MRPRLLIAIAASCLGLWACRTPEAARKTVSEAPTAAELRLAYSGPPETWPAPVILRPDGDAQFAEMGLSPPARPASAVSELGRDLFFSSVLSANEDLACATCHSPGHGFASTDRQAIGHNGMKGTRNAPTILGAMHTAPYFWDGRADTLEAQAVGPILNPIEMAGSRAVLEERLNSRAEWRERFQAVLSVETPTLEDVATALSAYERTLDVRTPFDAFLAGDRTAFDDRQVEGLHIFRTKGRCMSCHEGPALSDGAAHNIGLTYYGRKYEDLGLYRQTNAAEDVGRFNTPSLRHVSKTFPYMHNGLIPSLRGAVNYYNAGGARPKRKEGQEDDRLFPTTSPRLEPLGLSATEKEALIAFLETL